MSKMTREERIAAKRAALKKSQAQGSIGYDSPYSRDLKVYRPVEGKNRLRIMGVPGEMHYSIPTNIHYGIGPDKAAYLCRKHNSPDVIGDDNRCPVCEEALRRSIEASRMPEGADKEQAKRDAGEFRHSSRRFALVIDRTRPEDGIQIWNMPKSIAESLDEQMFDEDTNDFRELNDHYEGHDVGFKKEGTGINTKYSGVTVAPKPTPLSANEGQMKAWIEEFEGFKQSDLLVAYSYDHIAEVMGLQGVASAKASSGSSPTAARGGDRPTNQPAPAAVESPQAAVETAPAATVEDIFGEDDADLDDWDL